VEIWNKVIVLSVGGIFGVNARYWLGAWINRWASPQFPWVTVIIFDAVGKVGDRRSTNEGSE
jgi:fluoride exporter